VLVSVDTVGGRVTQAERTVYVQTLGAQADEFRDRLVMATSGVRTDHLRPRPGDFIFRSQAKRKTVYRSIGMFCLRARSRVPTIRRGSRHSRRLREEKTVVNSR